MTFRDEREAAHQRAEALQQELAEARAKLAALERVRPSRWRAVAAALVVTVGLGATTVGLFAAVAVWGRGRAARATVAAQEERMRQTEAEINAARRAGAEWSHSMTSLMQGRYRPEPPQGRITWRGVVDDSRDAAVRVGTTCVLEGDFRGPPAEIVALRLAVRCGVRVLYESTEETSPARVDLRDGPVLGSVERRYMLRLGDSAPTRGRRPWLTVSSEHHNAVVTRPDGARVSIYLRDVGDSAEGQLLFGGRCCAREPAFSGDVERALRVLSTRGRGPVARGARCEFVARAVWERAESCRIALRCGTTWVYGAHDSGYLACEVRGGAAIGALDMYPSSQGGDPRLTWQGNRVTVGDSGAAGAWELVLGP